MTLRNDFQRLKSSYEEKLRIKIRRSIWKSWNRFSICNEKERGKYGRKAVNYDSQITHKGVRVRGRKREKVRQRKSK